jgi:FkbM family methyltransferase
MGLPAPLRRTLEWTAGWAFAARRSLRRVPQRARAPAGAGSSGGRDPRLPADAPDAIVASNEHGLYCIPRASLHRPVAEWTAASKVWERATLELLCASDPDGDIVHAGTYFGDFLPALSRSRRGAARVWAFEPGSENSRCAAITLELNGLENVVLTRAGLSERPRQALLATGDREGVPLGGASRVINDRAKARWWEAEEVELLALDDAIDRERNVVAIHLDVEGHEQSALQGALELIARCRPLLVLETIPEEGWVDEHLAPLGYRARERVEWNHIFSCE